MAREGGTSTPGAPKVALQMASVPLCQTRRPILTRTAGQVNLYRRHDLGIWFDMDGTDPDYYKAAVRVTKITRHKSFDPRIDKGAGTPEPVELTKRGTRHNDRQRQQNRLLHDIKHASLITCITLLAYGYKINFRCPITWRRGATLAMVSLLVRYDQVMTCYGCNFHGDIYDLAGFTAGTDNTVEQYKAVARSFGDVGKRHV